MAEQAWSRAWRCGRVVVRAGLDPARRHSHAPTHLRAPRGRPRSRGADGVGDVRGGFMMPWASPSTDEMGETSWRRPFTAVHVLVLRIREENGWGAHGTPNCCRAHATQNL